MANQEKQGSEVRLDKPVTGGRNAWLEALAELEKPAAPAPAPAKAAAPVRPAVPTPAPASIAAPVVTVLGDLADVKARIGKARAALEAFVAAHPYLIAPNVYRMWEENMQESTVVIDRQSAQIRQRNGEVNS